MESSNGDGGPWGGLEGNRALREEESSKGEWEALRGFQKGLGLSGMESGMSGSSKKD